MTDGNEYDFITIGSATLDNFIESDKASIINASSIEKQSEFLCFPYGSKIEIDGFSRNTGGGGVNTAINFANLGFKTTTMVKLGEKDEIKDVVKKRLEKSGVDTANIIYSENASHGFSIILVSFQGDRTVLTHRAQMPTLKLKTLILRASKSQNGFMWHL
jgi:sugar/nucleoside kinase (ribokinase family)